MLINVKCVTTCDNQHGFYRNNSSEAQHIVTSNNFLLCLNAGRHTDALFLDFTKSFDKVPHKTLCCKLSYNEINGTILKWIGNF